MAVLRFAVWLARSLGRPVTRLLLVPVCLGFVLFHAEARTASRRYLARVLGRPRTVRDVLRHFFTFGTTVLDRVYLLNDEADRFDITIHGEEIVTEILAAGRRVPSARRPSRQFRGAAPGRPQAARPARQSCHVRGRPAARSAPR